MYIEKSFKCLKNKTIKRLTCGSLFCLMFLLIREALCAHPGEDLLESGAPRGVFSSMSSSLLNISLLMGTFVCFLLSIRVRSFLKDGQLASGWTLFSLSFILLLVAQLLGLSESLGWLKISPSIISTFRLLFVIFLASGIYLIKKVLS